MVEYGCSAWLRSSEDITLKMDRIIETHLSVCSRTFRGDKRERVSAHNISWVYIGFPYSFSILFKEADLSLSQWECQIPTPPSPSFPTINTHTYLFFYHSIMGTVNLYYFYRANNAFDPLTYPTYHQNISAFQLKKIIILYVK